MLIYFLCINWLWHGSWRWSSCHHYGPHQYRNHRGIYENYHWNGTNEAHMKTCFCSFSILFDYLDLFQVWSYNRNLFKWNTPNACHLKCRSKYKFGSSSSPHPGTYPKSNSSACGRGFSSNLCQDIRFINVFLAS